MSDIRRQSAPSIGVIPSRSIERAFVALLYTMILILAWLSVIGTFYGLRGIDAPLNPIAQVATIRALPISFALAFGAQAILALAQYGSRQFARKDRRWWLLYLAALGISVYYNIQAFYNPLTALIPIPIVVYVLIVAGDVLPEYIAVRH